MTLIITHIAKPGIVMVADSALSITEVSRNSVLFGLQKIFPCPQAKSAMGIWGSYDVRSRDGEIEALSTITSKIAREKVRTSPASLANRCQTILSERFNSIGQRVLSIDIAGLAETDNKLTPDFYRVSNTRGGPVFEIERLNAQSPTQFFAPEGAARDWAAQMWEFFSHKCIETETSPDELIILQMRRRRLANYVRFCGSVSMVPGVRRSVGGPIQSLSIRMTDGSIILEPLDFDDHIDSLPL